jgi:hypothetical protein
VQYMGTCSTVWIGEPHRQAIVLSINVSDIDSISSEICNCHPMSTESESECIEHCSAKRRYASGDEAAVGERGRETTGTMQTPVSQGGQATTQ